MTKITLPILILIMLVISPLFFSVTELNGDDERVLINDLQISQQVDCTTTPNINCRIDRVVYEGLTYREIFEYGYVNDFSTGLVDIQDSQDLQIHENSFTFDGIGSIATFSSNHIQYNLIDINNFGDITTNNHYHYTSVRIIDGDPINSFQHGRRFVTFYGGPFTFRTLTNEFTIQSVIDNSTNRLNDNLITFGGNINTRFEINYFGIVGLNIFITQPTQQQLDQWLEYYLEHKDQGIISDYYHIQSDTLINMSHQAYNGIDNLIVRTNNFIDWLTLDVASLLSRSIGFLGDKTYEILDDVGIISNDFTWWADFNDSLPTWLKRLVGLE